MSTFTTALGEVYTVERRLPRVAWRPRYRGADPAFGDFAGAVDDSILGVIGAVFFAITLVIIVIPFLLFVAELALVIAIVIPVVLFGLAVGAVRHTVVIKAGDAKGPVLASREARGVVASVRAARALRAEADAGRLRSAAAAQRRV